MLTAPPADASPESVPSAEPLVTRRMISHL